MSLDEALENVTNSETLLAFVRLLAQDKEDETTKESISPSSPYGAGSNGWQNRTIEAFLNASSNWAESTNFGLTQGIAPNNPWKQFAVFLYCGKIYE
jgi:hypothetical protein